MSERQMRKLIVKHFHGRISPQEEREMRLHLSGCANCTREYEKQLAFADIAGLGSAEERLARGLGFAPKREPLLKPIWITSGATLAVGFAAFVFLLSPRLLRKNEFQSRGSQSVTTHNELLIYAVRDNGKWSQVGDAILATAELGFAYRNPQQFRYVLIYGQDEHGHVYWYQPSWTGKESVAPTSVGIAMDADVHELTGVVAHDLDSDHLTVTAVFANIPIAVTSVEERLKQKLSPVENATMIVRQLQVKR